MDVEKGINIPEALVRCIPQKFHHSGSVDGKLRMEQKRGQDNLEKMSASSNNLNQCVNGK
jgi:hypothetical protein